MCFTLEHITDTTTGFLACTRQVLLGHESLRHDRQYPALACTLRLHENETTRLDPFESSRTAKVILTVEEPECQFHLEVKWHARLSCSGLNGFFGSRDYWRKPGCRIPHSYQIHSLNLRQSSVDPVPFLFRCDDDAIEGDQDEVDDEIVKIRKDSRVWVDFHNVQPNILILWDLLSPRGQILGLQHIFIAKNPRSRLASMWLMTSALLHKYHLLESVLAAVVHGGLDLNKLIRQWLMPSTQPSEEQWIQQFAFAQEQLHLLFVEHGATLAGTLLVLQKPYQCGRIQETLLNLFITTYTNDVGYAIKIHKRTLEIYDALTSKNIPLEPRDAFSSKLQLYNRVIDSGSRRWDETDTERDAKWQDDLKVQLEIVEVDYYLYEHTHYRTRCAMIDANIESFYDSEDWLPNVESCSSLKIDSLLSFRKEQQQKHPNFDLPPTILQFIDRIIYSNEDSIDQWWHEYDMQRDHKRINDLAEI